MNSVMPTANAGSRNGEIMTALAISDTSPMTGAQRKLHGQALALESAGKDWIDRFTKLAKAYLSSLPDGALFAFEDIRAFCDACELPAPITHKVWGAMPRVLIKAGLPMEMTDRARKARSPKTHAHRVPLYRKVGAY